MKNTLEALLQQDKIYIADVGSAGGPEEHWKNFASLCYYYTFDPHPGTAPWKCSEKNFQVGLWSHRSSQKLHLTAYPPASSLFQSNQEFLKSFPTFPYMQEIGTRRIDLHTLDRTLAGEHPIDFLKIDAEGAELEILKGATHQLGGCLGLQLEMAFTPLRNNAPTFSEIDQFVRGFDFQLFQIQREHWFRNNQVAGPECQPQLIWGNVLYLLPKPVFLKRLKGSDTPSLLLGKYLTILLAYQLFDYAYEICEEVGCEETKALQDCLKKKQFSKKEALKLLLSLTMGACKYTFALSKKGKQKYLSYLKRKTRLCGKMCLYLGRNDFGLYD